MTNEISSIDRVFELLNDLHDALEINSYTHEADLVARHIEELKSPQTESRILMDGNGIDLVMEELSQSFASL